MCADGFPGRLGSLVGVAQLFDTRPGGRPAPAPTRSKCYVGRVGALAVALGVGTAIMGVAATAVAEPGPGNAAGSSGEESTRAGGAGPASGRARAGNHRNVQGRVSDVDLGPPSALELPARGSAAAGIDSGGAMPGRRSGGARSGLAQAPAGVRTADRPTLIGAPSAAGAPEFPPAVSHGGVPLVPTSPEGLDAIVNGVGVIGDTVSTPQFAFAAAAAEAPGMTAAPQSGALSGSDSDPLALLGETSGGGAPLAAPLAWAALAAARREDLAGATPEAAPAATVTVGEPVDPAVEVTNSAAVGDSAAAAGDEEPTASNVSITSFSPASGYVGSPITITGQNFPAKGTSKGTLKQIDIGSGSTTEFTRVSDTEITLAVPTGATTGKITLVIGGTISPTKVTSSSNFTVNAPSITSISPSNGIVGSTVTITGSFFTADPETGATSVQFCGSTSNCSKNGVTASTVTVDSDTQITATVPDGASTGAIQVTTPSGTGKSPVKFTVDFNGQALPPLPPCSSAVCTALTTGVTPSLNAQPYVINQLSKTVEAALSAAGPALTCTTKGCPFPPGQTTASVANTIGMYGFNVIYALAGNLSNEVIGEQVVNLVTQSNVLNLISEQVASQVEKSFSSPLGTVPEDVAITVGNAVGTFVQNSFGNAQVAAALAPFLKTLGVPTTIGEATTLVRQLTLGGKTITEYLLEKFDTVAGARALIELVGDSTVQQNLGTAVADSVDVLLGLASPTWSGAPQVPDTAIADYLGTTAADLVLGPDTPGTSVLAATIGTAVQNLFTSIGPNLATDSGNALVTLLGQPNVGTSLSEFTVNGLFGFLQGPGGH